MAIVDKSLITTVPTLKANFRIDTPVRTLVSRKNCFGQIEQLDRKSAENCLRAEKRFNREINDYLDGIKGK